MKLNNNLIIGAALLGGGAYYAYTKGWFGSKKDNAQKANEQSKAELDRIAAEQAAAAAAAAAIVKTKNEVKQASTITNPKSYAGKVTHIQKELGIKEDGDPGRNADSQTNKKYASVYGLDKGIISPLNIDYYKSKVDNRLTLVAQKAAAAVAAKKAASAVNVTNDDKRFLELVNKAFVDVNEPTTFPKNLSFGKGQFSTLPRGGYVMKKGANNKFFALNPADFLVTL